MNTPLKNIKKEINTDSTTLVFEEENLSMNGQSLLNEKLISDNVYPKNIYKPKFLNIYLALFFFKIFCVLLIICLVVLFAISIYKIDKIDNIIENKIKDVIFKFFNFTSIENVIKNNEKLNNFTISDNPIILNRELNKVYDNFINNDMKKVEFWN